MQNKDIADNEKMSCFKLVQNNKARRVVGPEEMNMFYFITNQ